MFEQRISFVGRRYIVKGKFHKVIAETDSGAVKLDNGQWVSHTDLQNVDGKSNGFKVLPIAA